MLVSYRRNADSGLMQETSDLSVGEWIRQMVRSSLKVQSVRPGEEKLKVVRALASHSFPTGNIEGILEEIEKGRHDKG